MKYTKSAIGLLNARYRSVLKKCLLINLGLFALTAVTATPAMATAIIDGTVSEWDGDAIGDLSFVDDDPINATVIGIDNVGSGVLKISDITGGGDVTLATFDRQNGLVAPAVSATNAFIVGEENGDVDDEFLKIVLSGSQPDVTISSGLKTALQSALDVPSSSVLAGNGLTSTTNGVLDVGATDKSITVGADGIAVNVNTSGGLETDGTNGLQIKAGNGVEVGTSGVAVKAATDGGITVDANGVAVDTSVFTVKSAGNGLENTSGSVAVKAATDGGITVDTNGVAVDTSVFTVKSAGNGLENTSGSVAVKAATDGGITVDTNGVSVTAGSGITVDANGVSVAVDDSTLEVDGTSGNVQIKDNGVTLAKINSSNWTKDAVDAGSGNTGSDTVLATTSSVVGTINNKAQEATFTDSATAHTSIGGANTIQTAIQNVAGAVDTNTNTIGAREITAGTAGSLVGVTIGDDATADEISVTDALETLNATNVNENTSLNTLAGLINGASVDTATGAYVGSSATALNATAADGSTAAGNLTEAVNGASAINQAQNTALGVLNTDGTYKASALTDNMYKTSAGTGTDLAQSLNNLAGNITAITGGSITDAGAVNNNYTASSVSYTAPTATTPLATAIGQAYTNIGDAVTGTYGNVADDATVNGNLDSLDEAIGSRTYTEDYNIADDESVTDSLDKLDQAIGDRQYVNTKNVNYAASVISGEDVTTAISQVASNVGRKVQLTNTYNGIEKTNSVNQNINALNGKVGDVSTLNTDLENLTDDSGTAPETVVAALNNLDARLGRIHGLVASEDATETVDGDAYAGNLAVGTTVSQHLLALDSSVGDRREMDSLNNEINEASAESVAAGLTATGNAIGDMDFSSAHYYNESGADANLSDAVRTLDSNMYRIDREVSDLRHKFYNGMASMAAMTALVPNPRAAGNTSISLGTGAYHGRTAMALGAFHNITDNVMLNAGAAWGNNNDVAYRLGVTWSF